MGALDKLKSRMSGPGKTPLGRPTEPVSEQVNNSSLLSNENIETAKAAGKFVAKQGVKQALKSVGQKALSTVFGVGGMLLSSQKAYAGGNRTNKEWEEFLNPKTVNFKNPDTGDVKSVSVNDADAFNKVPEFKNYVRQDG